MYALFYVLSGALSPRIASGSVPLRLIIDTDQIRQYPILHRVPTSYFDKATGKTRNYAFVVGTHLGSLIHELASQLLFKIL